jgi:hypothetical protein
MIPTGIDSQTVEGIEPVIVKIMTHTKLNIYFVIGNTGIKSLKLSVTEQNVSKHFVCLHHDTNIHQVLYVMRNYLRPSQAEK